jgi:restriction endonuclease S subunit
MKNSIKTRKLKPSIKRITDKAKNLELNLNELTVYGVSKEDGITVTGKDIGKNLGNYFYFEGQKLAYNPYRVNIGSIGLSTPDFIGLISPAYVIFEVDETIYPEFLLLYLKSNVGIRAIKWYGDRGGVRSSLRFSDLGKIDFPDITYEEQKAFYIDYLNKFKTVKKADIEFDKQLGLITKLRQSILQDAVQGKLTQEWRVQNSITETASELLNKIIAEKEQLIKDKKIKKENPLPPITKNEIPFEIPDGWKWCRVGTFTQIQNGYAFKSSKFTSSGVPLLRNINISNGYINWTDTAFYSEHELIGLERFKLYEGDIVISLDRPLISTGLKISKITQNDLPSMLLQRVGRFAVKDLRISSDFLYIWLNSNEFISKLNPGKSIGVPHISTKDVEKYIFALPSFQEQKAITKKVNQLLDHYDVLEKEIKVSKTNAEKLMQSVLSELLGEENNVLVNKPTTKKEDKKPSREIKYNSKTLLMDLVKLLKENGKLHAEDLWKMSKYPKDIDAFYAELKKQVEEKKSIKEVETEKGYLELV